MNTKYKKVEEYVDLSRIKYDEPMKKHTTIRIGGPADVLVLPETKEEIINVLKYAKEENIPITIIGNGSKLLVLDEGIRGIVIKIGSKMSNVIIDKECIIFGAGITMPRLAAIAKDNALSGLEFSAGIPGNLGGGIYMNAGAYGSELSNVIEEVTYIDENLEIKTLKNEECNFGYRRSIFRDMTNPIIIEGKVKLKRGNKEDIEELMRENNTLRKEKQPLEYPNAGSTFKRPEGFFVGKIIDDMGLKGYSIGDAQISTKHSGFIVNKGNATAKDVVELIEYIKKKAYETFNVKLEEEIIVLKKGE